ncbi:hypothetical protein [Actinomadura sp. WMMA1423]|uniref:hypothetical protein n=1 Tax=Actinomadura sp. WMMA1423 TaxID=2591108 RepID=UPI0011475D04|nr:hypothetical protein [Actinomadura sp. WMMA1423]
MGTANDDVHCAMARHVALALWTMPVLAALLSVPLALGVDGTTGAKIGVGAVAILVFAASFMSGGAFGFLFGLPRARLVDQMTRDGTRPSGHFLANANLARISDWVTTIIVGLTLVNLRSLVGSLGRLGANLKVPLGNAPYSAAAGIALVLVGTPAGFLLAFLWTTIRMRALLEELDEEGQEGKEVVPDLKSETLARAGSIVRSKAPGLRGAPRRLVTRTLRRWDGKLRKWGDALRKRDRAHPPVPPGKGASKHDRDNTPPAG